MSVKKYTTFEDGWKLFLAGPLQTNFAAWFGWTCGFVLLATFARIIHYVLDQTFF